MQKITFSIKLLAISLMVSACKNQLSQPQTQQSVELKSEYDFYFNFSPRLLYTDMSNLIDYEARLATHLQLFSGEIEIKKILHKVRSFIAYAVYSRCFEEPKVARPLKRHHLEKSWLDRYDLNYYDKNKTKRRLSIDETKICSVFLKKIKELTFDQIDLSQPNSSFFTKVMNNQVTSFSRQKMNNQQQLFFRETLAPRIISLTKQSMARADFIFPFHSYDYFTECEKQKVSHYERGKPIYRYPMSDRIDCKMLQKLPEFSAPPPRKRRDCRNPSKSYPEKDTIFAPFAGPDNLMIEVNSVISKLNNYRADLDKMVTKIKLDKETGGKQGHIQDHHESPYLTKEPLILPFIKLINATNLKADKVIKANDSYLCVLTESTKMGILPILFSKAIRQETGNVHLNHKGRFFGLGRVEYPPLAVPSSKSTRNALDEIKKELVSNWLEFQVAIKSTEMKAEKIYATILNNEIAVAQLIMQNPAHSPVIDSLVRKFQHKPITPKWLRTFKKFSLAADLVFIPVVILGGFVTGGVGVVPLLLMANAVNFLWVGSASASAIISRNRLELVERSLLTGNSEQIARGLNILREFEERKRNLTVSAGVGATLTVANLGLIAKGLDSLATVPIDIQAAVFADIDVLTPSDETESDTDQHNQR